MTPSMKGLVYLVSFFAVADASDGKASDGMASARRLTHVFTTPHPYAAEGGAEWLYHLCTMWQMNQTGYLGADPKNWCVPWQNGAALGKCYDANGNQDAQCAKGVQQMACDKAACDKLTAEEKAGYAFSAAMIGDYYRGTKGKYPDGPPYNKVDPVPWVPCLVACYLIAVCSWLGGVLAIPPMRKFIEANYDQMQGVLAGFGSGAILSHIFVLRIWTATLMVNERVNKWDKDVWFKDGKYDLVQHEASITETRALLGWALCVIFGFLCPSIWDNVVCLICSLLKNHPKCAKNKGGEDEPVKEGEVIIPEKTWWEKLRMIVAVDYSNSIIHFWDGVFIASAWVSAGCEGAFGWKFFAALLIIRIPQGIADYTLLTGPGCRMRWWVACCFNYADAMLLPMGAAMTLSDAEAETPMNDDAFDIGMMQMFALGLYLQLALVELLPRTLKNTLNWKWRCVASSAFLIGVIWVGLALTLFDECKPKLGLLTNDDNTPEGQYWLEMSFPHHHFPEGIMIMAYSPR